MKSLKTIVLAAALFVGIYPAVFGAVTFTDSPSVVSNTYSGFITLQINGIASGDTVVVQKFLDANGDGIVDSGDTLLQQFNLTDNQAGQVLGGATNFNVPGDLNTTAGAITALLNFQNGDFVQNLVAKYLYVLSSPSGHFTPITNSFTITNFPFAQQFTGNVVSNSTITTLPGAIIILFPPPRSGHNGPGQPLAGAVANTAGAYSVAVPAGTYTLVTVCSNFISDFATAPVLTLGAGQTINTNLSLSTNATTSISGTLVDAANNPIRLPGIFMPLIMSANNDTFLVVTFSDTNGNFTAPVINGQWTVGSDNSGLTVHGYVGYNNGTNVNSGSSGVTIPFSRATALFYGSVKDNLGNPIAAVDVGANETNNLYGTDGYTDPNGNYFVGVLGLGNDPWQLQLTGENAFLSNYIVSQPSFDQNGGTNLTAETALLQNFTIVLATNTISGTVIDTSSNAIANVQLFANATIDGINYAAQATSAGNGGYSMNVGSGVWTVGVNCSSIGNYQCPNLATVTIANNNAVTNFILLQCGAVQITTPSPLPVGEAGLFYSLNLQASSCYPNFTWQQTAGNLPPGLSLQNGTVLGTPSTAGVYNFTLSVTDGNSAKTSQSFSLTISNALAIYTTSLPNGTNNLSYSQQLQAMNGVPPYNWSLTSGSLPANLSLSSGGLISGNASPIGTFNFKVQVTDSLGATANQALSMGIVHTNIPPLAIAASGSQVFILWPASAGTNFTLETTTNLATGPWVPATNGVPQAAYLFTNSAPTTFYRLQ